ncbi:isochorismatase family protein [Nocardia sp. NPDC059246]|uniref:isochorismatase family protein n=1 Tax=unclassified Nocardia TaxID=2637762 RepID=UPI0036B8F7FE
MRQVIRECAAYWRGGAEAAGSDHAVCDQSTAADRLVLAGLTTSIGVESTARAGYEHGYHVTLATDAMADLDEGVRRRGRPGGGGLGRDGYQAGPQPRRRLCRRGCHSSSDTLGAASSVLAQLK